jgi:hypothetical protein
MAGIVPPGRLNREHVGFDYFSSVSEDSVDQTGASWNRVVLWMRQLQTLSQVS